MAVLLTPPTTSDWIPAWARLVHTLYWLVTVLAVVTLADYVVQGIRQYREAKRGHLNATAPATEEAIRP